MWSHSPLSMSVIQRDGKPCLFSERIEWREDELIKNIRLFFESEIIGESRPWVGLRYWQSQPSQTVQWWRDGCDSSRKKWSILTFVTTSNRSSLPLHVRTTILIAFQDDFMHKILHFSNSMTETPETLLWRPMQAFVNWSSLWLRIYYLCDYSES